MGLGVNRRAGVERVAQAVLRCGTRHELRDALCAGAADRERIEVRLRVELGGQERRAPAPALCAGAGSAGAKRAGTKAGSVERRSPAAPPKPTEREPGFSV